MMNTKYQSNLAKTVASLQYALIFVLLLTLTFLLLLVLGEKTYIVWGDQGHWHALDDHMITQRVAYNIWQNGEPYYNAGERVAANTSLFWPYLLSVVYIFFDHRTAIPIVIALSAFLYALTIILTVYQIRNIWVRYAVLSFLTLSSSTLMYATSAWEHIPQMLLFTSGSLLILRKTINADRSLPSLSMALYSLAFMMRPDTAIALIVPAIVWVVQSFISRSYIKLLWLCAFIVIPVFYLWMMYTIYGGFWPNTAYLKLAFGMETLGMGVAYLFRPSESGITPYLILLLVLSIKWLNSRERLITASMVSYALYVVSIGGDYFGDGRYFLFLMPTALLLVVRFISRSLPGADKPIALALTAILLFTYLPILTYAAIRNISLVDSVDTRDSISEQIFLAQIINDRLEPDDGSIGLHHLGIGYHIPRFHVVDFLGKAEPYIARRSPIPDQPIGHNKFDYPYAFARYNIAAIPIGSCVTVQSTIDTTRPHHYWQLACREALLSGNYTFISFDDYGVTGMGLMVRNDLVTRFHE